MMDKIRQLCDEKIAQILNNNKMLSSDIKEKQLLKLKNLKKFLSNDMCFFDIDINVAYNILLYLGVKKHELKECYSQLVSFEQYSNNKPYTLIDDQILNNFKHLAL